MNDPSSHRKIAVIGAGNMASAIVRGNLHAASSPVSLSNWVVVARSEQRRDRWGELGVHLRASIADLAHDWPSISTVLIATKPQMLADVSKETALADLDFTNKQVVSVLAGTRIDSLRAAFIGNPPVIRAMPNTPLRVGLGLTALCASSDTPARALGFVRSIFEAAGATIDLEEGLFDAFTALAGSGPAYLFYLAEAMQTAALRTGFSESQAREIVNATLLGSATLLAADTKDPAMLRAAVTSKGGTTHAATSSMDEQGVMDSIADAIVRGRDRGRELAQD